MHIFTEPAPPADARIKYGPDALNFGDLHLPSGDDAHPVAIVIHGGFWRARYDLEHIGHACAALTAAGVATWSIEYRRIGNPGGGWPGTFLDVAAAADYLRELAPEYNLDLNRVVTVGHSAGGHLALWLSSRHRIPRSDPLYQSAPLPLKAGISLAGVVDLQHAWELRLSNGAVAELMGGNPLEFPDRFATTSPIEMLPVGIWQILLHGIDDEDVPFEISQRYHETAISRGDGATLYVLACGHFELIDPLSPEWPEVVQAVREGAGIPL